LAGAEANRVVFVPEVLTPFDFVKPTAAKNKQIKILLSIKSINEFIFLLGDSLRSTLHSSPFGQNICFAYIIGLIAHKPASTVLSHE
jgi:hypothetical protein